MKSICLLSPQIMALRLSAQAMISDSFESLPATALATVPASVAASLPTLPASQTASPQPAQSGSEASLLSEVRPRPELE